MKRALITGAAGFLGRRVTERLLAGDWTVTAIDTRDHPNQADYVRDALDFYRHRNVTYDLVAHCAAYVGGREGIEGRPTYLAAVNLQLDAALFEWALRTRPAHIIYWSSSAAYPVNLQSRLMNRWSGEIYRLRETDIDHDEPLKPDASYGAVKIAGEQLALWAQAEGLRVHVFRPFSGYGPEQSLDYPFPSFIDRGRRRADPFEVWGTGEQVRDWIHVEDVITAALTAVEQDYPGPLNLCTGIGTSFNQLAGLVCKSAGYQPVIHHRPEKPSGVHYRVGDPTEMNKIWTPRITIEQGIRDALSG